MPIAASLIDRSPFESKNVAMLARGAVVVSLAAAAASAAVGGPLLALLSTSTAHATSTRLAAVSFAAAMATLVVAAFVGAWQHRLHIVGVLCAGAAIAWVAPVVIGWHSGPTAVRLVATVVAPLLVPVLIHVLLLGPDGRLSAGRRLRCAVAAYGIAATCSLLVFLTRDPFYDPNCWNDCDVAGAALASRSTALVASIGWSLFVAAAAGASVIWLIIRLRNERVARRWSLCITMPAALSLATLSVAGVRRLMGVRESSLDTTFAVAFTATAIALGLLGVGVIVMAGSTWRRRAAVARLAERLGAAPQPGTLQAALRIAVGDPGLRVIYRLPHSGRYVDAAGGTVAESAEESGSVVLRRDDETFAVITFDREVIDARVVLDALGNASRMTIENERMNAELAAQLADLNESRARIVETADSTRREIERDLHDGAQAGLVAAIFRLGIARNVDPAPVVDDLIRRAQLAAGELRDLTHGVYPTTLDDLGLEDALISLAGERTMSFTLGTSLASRWPPAVERAIYVVAVAVARSGRDVAMRIDEEHHALGVRVTGAALDPLDEEYLSDRIAAVGGTLTIDGESLTAWLPTGSPLERPSAQPIRVQGL